MPWVAGHHNQVEDHHRAAVPEAVREDMLDLEGQDVRNRVPMAEEQSWNRCGDTLVGFHGRTAGRGLVGELVRWEAPTSQVAA